jgi:hypothetical protein
VLVLSYPTSSACRGSEVNGKYPGCHISQKPNLCCTNCRGTQNIPFANEGVNGSIHFGICMSPVDDNLPTPISALHFRPHLPTLYSLDSSGAELSNERIRAVRTVGLFGIF